MTKSSLKSSISALFTKNVQLVDSEPLLPAACLILASTLDEDSQKRIIPTSHTPKFRYNHDSEPASSPKAWSCIRVLYQILARVLALWGCLALLFMTINTRGVSGKRYTGDCDCGTSTVEAKNRGCTWDSLAGAWLPDRCRDEELTAIFEKTGPNGTWTYYADEKQTMSLSETEVSLLADGLDTTYWVTLDWHIEHCLFYWKKSQRARWTQKLLESRFDNLDHIEHCEDLIMGRRKFDSKTVMKLHAELKSEWVPDFASAGLKRPVSGRP